MESPFISIIIPTYNRAHIIGDTLESIHSQTYTQWECIVVDDGSTDETASLMENWLAKDNRFQYMHRPSQMNKGPNSCRNHGFSKSKGNYVQWFDSDDLYKPHALATYVEQITEGTDAVVAKLERINLDTGIKIDENNIISENEILDYLEGRITFYVSGPVWKRTFLEQHHALFDEDIRNMDDWDFNLRMLYKEPNIAYINNPLIEYRIHENSLFQELDKINIAEIESDIKAREKHVQLLRKNGMADYKVVQKFIAMRYFKFLRRALYTKAGNSWYLFKKAVGSHLRIKDYKTALRIIVGFISYRLFKKGYNLLKK